MAEPGQGAQVAAQTLFTAASAANAIPVAGQFVSAGLAIAGLFTKLFGGKRKAKRAAAREKRTRELSANLGVRNPAAQRPATTGGLAAPQSIQQPTTFSPNVDAPTTTFSGGAQEPTVQELPQQTIDSGKF